MAKRPTTDPIDKTGMPCGRRDGFTAAFTPPESDHWEDDGGCSYCGSLDPRVLLERIEAGTVRLDPTDKSYKVYVNNDGGAPFKQTYRDCNEHNADGTLGAKKLPLCHGPDDCEHWVTRDMTTTKFYFQHFNVEQMQKFVDLLNAKKIKLGEPGYFYVRPFFIARQPAP